MVVKKDKNRELTLEESLSIIDRHAAAEEILNFKNHRKHPLKPNTFRFTVDLLSLELIIGLMEEEQVKNVFFNPSIPPPGGTVDSISLRYKIYIEYHFMKN